MDVRSRHSIREHLQKEEVQERIIQNIHRGRDEATVTISRAAELFGITENKLRDWEEYGFLSPLRPGGPKGRRLYTPSELDKLAIIRELINTGYSASDIPADIDKVWSSIRGLREPTHPIEQTETVLQTFPQHYIDHSINERISTARKELFWRYYLSRALRLSLKLLCEDIPNTTAGLILPLAPEIDVTTITRVEDLATVGESIIGWLSQSGSSQTLLTQNPFFQYSSDFRIEPLQSKNEGSSPQAARALVVLQREASPLNPGPEVVETIYRLLAPIYENGELSRLCLGPGMRDILDAATDLDNNLNYDDVTLAGMADMIIDLGGIGEGDGPRWSCSWLLIPRDTSQPLHLSNLVVRAQSRTAYVPSRAAIPVPDKHIENPYMRALRSRHIIYYPDISSTTELQSTEIVPGVTMNSALAMPIGGEDGIPTGVLYIVSRHKQAFTASDQRVLRLLSRMLDELLKTYRIRQQITYKLTEAIKNPTLIDTMYERFASETDFNRDVEDLLQSVQQSRGDEEKLAQKTVSFIALDIDKQSSLANKYGDRLVRNLTREVGLRVQEQMRSFFKEYPDCQLYHIYADRFFIVLRNTSLEMAREHAEQLRMGVVGAYKLDGQRVFADQQTRPDSMLELSDITIRLGVTSYPYTKLDEILREHPSEYAVSEVRSIITSALDVALVKGQIEGGNVVVSWNYDIRNFVRWTPVKSK